MKVFTPRHMRKRYSGKNGSPDVAKKALFRRCARISKQFIHQSASNLESPALHNQYVMYCERTAKGTGFRS